MRVSAHSVHLLPAAQISTFLQHLRQLYRQRNTYHNFQHALDVFQATYFFLYTAGMVPPVSILLHGDTRMWRSDKRRTKKDKSFIDCLGHEDIFALYIAAVGHDVGHPGLTNAFLVCHSSVYSSCFYADARDHSATPRRPSRSSSRTRRWSRCTTVS